MILRGGGGWRFRGWRGGERGFGGGRGWEGEGRRVGGEEGIRPWKWMMCCLGDFRDVHGYGRGAVQRVLEAVKACGAATKDRYGSVCLETRNQLLYHPQN